LVGRLPQPALKLFLRGPDQPPAGGDVIGAGGKWMADFEEKRGYRLTQFGQAT
jgi:hypothetical protein